MTVNMYARRVSNMYDVRIHVCKPLLKHFDGEQLTVNCKIITVPRYREIGRNHLYMSPI